jgi:hypothetical protein
MDDGVPCAGPRRVRHGGKDEHHTSQLHDAQEHDDEHKADETELDHGAAPVCSQTLKSPYFHWMILIIV